MVHQHGADKAGAAVPEELYNLTQLADVTLAAGKLSTESSAASTEAIGRSGLSAFTPVRQSFHPFPVGYGSIQNQSIQQHPQQHRSSAAASASSDDDMSTYTCGNFSGSSITRNYAHKIFDKRKARNQQLTTTMTLTMPTDTMPTLTNINAHLCWAERDRLKCPTISATIDCHDHTQNNHRTESMADIELSKAKTRSAVEEVEQPDDDELDGLVMDDGEIDRELEDVDDDQLEVAEGDESDIHVCPECGKKYSTSSNLARHRQTHRSLMDKKARRCPHCDKVYVSMPAFSMHVRTHNQGCECPHCGKRFSRPWLLQGHIRTHTGEKPFECSICNKAFADKSNLRAHIQTHSNTKPHTCTRCGKSFALKSYLYKHEESSCVRNLNKSSSSSSSSSSTSPTDKCKPPRRSDSSASSSSSSSSSCSTPCSQSVKSTTNVAVTLAKVMKRGKTTTTELQRKCREKLRDKLRGPAAKLKQIENERMYNIVQQPHPVTTDSGSQKSYIDLSHSPVPRMEHYSRISVIRSVVSNDPGPISGQMTVTHQRQLDRTGVSAQGQHDNATNSDKDTHMSMGFYQEMPMDFSPKATSSFATNSGSSFGIAKYAVIA